MKKFSFIFDRSKKAKILKKNILKNYRNWPIKRSNIIIVGGGDGFMLKTIKNLYKFNKPFYGINCGSIGFLLNRYLSKKISQRVNKAKITTIYPLQIKTVSRGKKRSSFLAINELSLLRQSKQTALLKLKINKKILIKKLIGDGVLLSTPAGSTAYNLSVHGPILSLNSKKLAITPISPFRPRRWKGKIVSDKTSVYITNLDPKKRPVAAVADNNEIRNVVSVKASINKRIKFKLLFNSSESLFKKIKSEQKKKIN
tara:strand:- start:1373 stop:2140 length:768 start_codon:yes stop_codon:yes gene_type:complete